MKFQNQLALLAILSLATINSQAHVSFENDTATQGSYKRFALKLPHGCGVAATTQVKINLPEGIQGAKPMPKAGWKLSTVTATLTQPYTTHGTQVTQDVATITWSEGLLPNEYYDEFVFQAKVATDRSMLAFPVEQKCGEQIVKWIDADHDGEHPAAMLNITKPNGHTPSH